LFRRKAVEKSVVPLRSVARFPEVKIGKNVTVVRAHSVLACSTSVVCGTNWSVLDATIVTVPFSVRKIDKALTE